MHNSQYMNTEERTGIHDNALLIAEKIISIRGSQSETKMRCGEGGDTVSHRSRFPADMYAMFDTLRLQNTEEAPPTYGKWGTPTHINK